MKKFFASAVLAAASILGMQATNVYILGNVGDQGWDPSVGTPMTSTDDKVFTYTGDFKESSYFSFTTQLASSSSGWDEITSYRIGALSDGYKLNASNFDQVVETGEMGYSGGNAFLITAAGNYTLTLNIEEETLVCHLNSGGEEEVITPDGLYVMGQVNGQDWNTNEGTKMTTTDNNIYKADILISGETGTFSFTRALSKSAANWSGIAQYRFGATYNQYQLIEELGQEVACGDDGTDYSFELPQGYYSLVVNLAEKTLVCTTEDAPAQKYYIVGSAPFGDWDPAKAVELTKEGEVYTTQAVVDGDIYFVFSGAKGSWAAVNGFRFGPTEANEDIAAGVEVTTQISTNDGASYHFTGEGVEYTITFDPENLVFKFEGAADIKGDVNGDGEVDVTDINCIVNVILGTATKETYPKADVNGDGDIDVTDVNALINIILGQ